jgi:hypothetical protein
MDPSSIPESLTSPGERILVEFLVDEEVQISRWLRTRRIANPRVIDTETGRVLLDLWDSDWDANMQWVDYVTVRLDLYIWNLRRSFIVLINAEYQSYCLLEQGGVWRTLRGAECPVKTALQEALDRRLKCSVAAGC